VKKHSFRPLPHRPVRQPFVVWQSTSHIDLNPIPIRLVARTHRTRNIIFEKRLGIPERWGVIATSRRSEFNMITFSVRTTSYKTNRTLFERLNGSPLYEACCSINTRMKIIPKRRKNVTGYTEINLRSFPALKFMSLPQTSHRQYAFELLYSVPLRIVSLTSLESPPF